MDVKLLNCLNIFNENCTQIIGDVEYLALSPNGSKYWNYKRTSWIYMWRRIWLKWPTSQLRCRPWQPNTFSSEKLHKMENMNDRNGFHPLSRRNWLFCCFGKPLWRRTADNASTEKSQILCWYNVNLGDMWTTTSLFSTVSDKEITMTTTPCFLRCYWC